MEDTDSALRAGIRLVKEGGADIVKLDGASEFPEAVRALQHTAGFLRTELSHRMQLYSVPQLHFAYDDSIESGMRLSQLIDEAVAEDRSKHRE